MSNTEMAARARIEELMVELERLIDIEIAIGATPARMIRVRTDLIRAIASLKAITSDQDSAA